MLKKLGILITISLSLILVIGCNDKSTEEEEEGIAVNLIIQSQSEYASESSFDSEENNKDGYYKQVYTYENLKYSFERMLHEEYSSFPIAVREGDVSDLKYDDNSINNKMKNKLSYPAYKASYKNTVGDKIYYNEDVLISTDDWDFRFHIEVLEDNYDKYKGIIDDIIYSITVDEIN